MLDYINTNAFRDLGHFVLWYRGDRPFNMNILNQNCIIWCKHESILGLFNNLRFSNRKYVLITGGSDYPLTQNIFFAKPPCIKKWYTTNAAYIHPELIPIPVGITPTKDVDKTGLDVGWFSDNINRLKSNKKDNEHLYCRWSNTSPKRLSVVQKLENANLKYTLDSPVFPENFINLKIKAKEIGFDTNSWTELNKLMKYYDYCEQMSKYKFIISPPGNGADCHRTWDALYMGCFPIVLKNNIYRETENDLPIIQVNDWSEITYELLNSYLNKEYNYEKLYMKYWKDRITKDFEEL